jgi:hypothetical protein
MNVSEASAVPTGKRGYVGSQKGAIGMERGQYLVAYMSMSKDYIDFRQKLDRFRPRYGELQFEWIDDDDGFGL